MAKRYVTRGFGFAGADRRRWIVRRVWVVDAGGIRRRGTMWSVQGDNVRIRVDEVPNVTVLPVAARGERWDFVDAATDT
jgi:hypothetical protein